jgi:hypothetical protein
MSDLKKLVLIVFWLEDATVLKKSNLAPVQRAQQRHVREQVVLQPADRRV